MNSSRTILDLLTQTIKIIDGYLIPLVFSIAFLFFIWGIFKYFIAGGDKVESQEAGKKFLMYGLSGFVIIIGIWGIINLLLASLPFNNQTRPDLPKFETAAERAES